MKIQAKLWIFLGLILFFRPAMAAEADYAIVIKDHRFIPEVLEIPSGKKVKIQVENQDASPEEFESYDLNREKIIGGGKQATIFVGPLKPGVYKYFGEFHPTTAKGVIKVRE